MSLQKPSRIPEPGFWRHYKHDEAKGMSDHVYEFQSVAFNTEYTEGSGKAKWLVNYLPLYECPVYTAAKEAGTPLGFSRSIDEWFEHVEKDRKMVPRFKKITDPGVIGYLEKIRDQMYPKS